MSVLSPRCSVSGLPCLHVCGDGASLSQALEAFVRVVEEHPVLRFEVRLRCTGCLQTQNEKRCYSKRHLRVLQCILYKQESSLKLWLYWERAAFDNELPVVENLITGHFSYVVKVCLNQNNSWTYLAEGCLIQGSRQSLRCRRCSWFQWRWLLAAPCGCNREGSEKEPDQYIYLLYYHRFMEKRIYVVQFARIAPFYFIFFPEHCAEKRCWLIIIKFLVK